MKKFVILILVLSVLLTCTACGKQNSIDTEPKVSQMKAICELAVMDCYYHNVAKYKKEDAEGFLLWKKDKHFWIEYSGVVTLGIDASLVSLEVADDEVIITIPEAQVLGCKVHTESLTKDSFIVDKDSADIKAEDETEAFRIAQEQLAKDAASDRTLLANAQQRAQSLLEEYVMNIGKVVGKSYSIKWNYVDVEGDPIGNNSNDLTSDTYLTPES